MTNLRPIIRNILADQADNRVFTNIHDQVPKSIINQVDRLRIDTNTIISYNIGLKHKYKLK